MVQRLPLASRHLTQVKPALGRDELQRCGKTACGCHVWVEFGRIGIPRHDPSVPDIGTAPAPFLGHLSRTSWRR